MPRRGENIFKRKDGRWEARYVKEITLDGIKKYGSVYAKTYKEVKAKQQQLVNKPTLKPTTFGLTVSRVMTEWLNENKNNLKISSFQKYSGVISKHIAPRIGQMELKFITPIVLTEFANALITEGGLSKETANLVLIVLGMGFDYAMERYSVDTPDIHLMKSDRGAICVLSAAEQQTIVSYLLSQGDVFAFGILVALYTGIRIGELCALRWENVSESAIHICGTMQRLKGNDGKTKVKILPPKTASSDRIIPIPIALKSAIEQCRRKSGYVLERPNGRFTEPRLLQYKFEKLLVECGIAKTNFHTLRHTFATRCIEAGVDVKTLSELLGHSDVKTTLNKYVHSSLELKQISVDKLAIAI